MYDVAVIGAGWAGFNASLRAKELGLKVCLIEAGQLGGTCLNNGCIPTKTLIHSAKLLSLTRKSSAFGIDTTNSQVNFAKIQERKTRIIQQLQQGMRSLLKGLDFFNSEAEIVSDRQIKTAGTIIHTKNIIIACGSKPFELSAFRFDGKKILSSDDILNLKEIPKSLLIIGGGVIGCEFASLLSTLGTQVSIAEKMPQLLPGEDREIAKKIEVVFKKKGIKVNTNTDAQVLDLNNYELVLVCVGRIPNTARLNLDKLGVKLEKSKIIVDDYLRTSVPAIYAAGDCTGRTMLAHFAAYQGRVAAGNAAVPEKPSRIDNTNIPNCIFTEPEIASVGICEETAKNCGMAIEVRKLDFLSSGMARILDETDGFIKVILDSKTKQILGASIIGPRATELIGIFTVAVSLRLEASQLSKIIFAHPTLSECITDILRSSHAL